MAGYSTTPLVNKLGIKESFRVTFVNAPEGFIKELGPLPDNVKLLSRATRAVDLILFFTKSESEMLKSFTRLAECLTPAGMLWVAWPKKASGVPTDLSFEVVQRVGLEAGLVDTKICAVNETWSGLKFVIRLKDRPKREGKA
jgi:hypothetical protein